ncbi:hypothetical protein PGS49_16035 [Yersinia intermedia]|uniref:hypothetical protein n=1 Tax=Yersinia intermedia TaxID=631 RepID=UPI0022FF4082|nr:hypothetical protein [Yersinia intermedia]MDA5482156.1 hypothetical protein [Yersinia intermedia]
MADKKYCYRYVDGNDYKGRPIVMLSQMVIIRETEKTFWYCHDYPQMSLEQIIQYRSRPGDRQVKRSLKNAARSRYHYTKEEAFKAFIYRKQYQLERILLTSETVILCLKWIRETGFIETGKDGGFNHFSNILSVPDKEFRAAEEPGPIASQLSWGEC